MTIETLPTEATGNNLPAKMEYARSLAASGLLPKDYRNNPANLLFAIEFADMLGLPPMVAVTGIHVISGTPTASASLIATLVRRAGHKLRTVRTHDGATSTIIRTDDPDYEHTATFTLDDAKAAGLLTNDNWRKRPLVMCEWRSISAVARLACSEALFGVQYTTEELTEERGPDGVPSVTKARQPRPRSVMEAVQQREQTTTPPAPGRGLLDLIEDATTADELRALWSRIPELPEHDQDTARDAILTRRGQLDQADDVLDGEVVA